MSGTLEGGRKAAKTNKKLYGEDFYRIAGSKGGQRNYGKPKGFAAMDKDKVCRAGQKGGAISRRTGIKNGEGKETQYIWGGGQDGRLVFKETQ
jgi:general stress protein YciG